MQVLTFVVIGMGILIVLGLALVAYGLVTRVSKDDASLANLGDLDLKLPPGCMIAQAQASDGRLIVRADGPEERGCQQVFILDLSEGKILGRIHARMDNVQNQ